MTYFEKQEWETIEADIETLEGRIVEIEVAMQENGLTLLGSVSTPGTG